MATLSTKVNFLLVGLNLTVTVLSQILTDFTLSRVLEY